MLNARTSLLIALGFSFVSGAVWVASYWFDLTVDRTVNWEANGWVCWSGITLEIGDGEIDAYKNASYEDPTGGKNQLKTVKWSSQISRIIASSSPDGYSVRDPNEAWRFGTAFQSFAGFGYQDLSRMDEDVYNWVVPLYAPSFFFLISTAYFLAILLRQGYRRKNNRCVQCGYDLRASPGRCPECGLKVASKTVAGFVNPITVTVSSVHAQSACD